MAIPISADENQSIQIGDVEYICKAVCGDLDYEIMDMVEKFQAQEDKSTRAYLEIQDRIIDRILVGWKSEKVLPAFPSQPSKLIPRGHKDRLSLFIQDMRGLNDVEKKSS